MRLEIRLDQEAAKQLLGEAIATLLLSGNRINVESVSWSHGGEGTIISINTENSSTKNT